MRTIRDRYGEKFLFSRGLGRFASFVLLDATLREYATRICASCKPGFRPNVDHSLTTHRKLRFTLLQQFHSQGLAMSLSHESKYPSRRTYVLKLRSDAKPGALAGRLENIVTGRQHAFESAHEFLDAITNELAAISGEPPPGEP
jgi:hypothetical protein